jgi:uncharacterized membrane protein
MIGDLFRLAGKLVDTVKKPLFGRTFYCPVCHLELSAYDTDANGNLVCPLCGVVIELHETYGHFVPIVNDVEINRSQPKARLHPLATHLPIGLFPLACLTAGIVLLVSLYAKLPGMTSQSCEFCTQTSPVLDNVTLLLVAISVFFSALTFLTGFLDWRTRYGGRPYRIITLKLILSGLFLAFGVVIIALHSFVFSAGMILFNSVINIIATVVYFGSLGIALIMLTALGHVGGYLVFGR